MKTITVYSSLNDDQVILFIDLDFPYTPPEKRQKRLEEIRGKYPCQRIKAI